MSVLACGSLATKRPWGELMSTPIGGATRGLWIEPSEVHKAAEAARKVAHDIPEDIKALFTPTDTAVAGLVGFQSAQAIDDCLEAWT